MKQTSEKRKRLEKLIRTRAASSGGRFREVITLPQHTSREDWIEAHLVFFYNETEAVYELCQTDAKRFSKSGEGFPPRFEYKISHKGGKPERCSASQYVAYVFSWIAGFVGKSGGVKAKSPNDIVKFDALTNKAFTRLFRVLAIIYHSHFKVVEENDGAGLLNVTFKHFYYFCLEHMEVDRNEFKALATLCQRLDSMYIAESMQPRGNTRRGDLSGIVQATDMFSPGRKSTRKDLRAALHQQSRADLMRAPAPDNTNNGAGRQRSIFFDSAATLSRASSVYAQLVKVHEGSSPKGQACVDAARGLFETESSFGEMLWSLHDDFMLPAQDLDFDTKYIHEMFVNISDILRLSELLVVEMHLALIDRLDSASNLTIPNVVSAVVESIKPHLWFFTLYSRFLATYDRTVAAIKSEKARNRKFLALLDEQEDFVLKSLKKVAERPAELRKMLAVLTDTFVAFSKSDAQGGGGIVVAHDFVDSASQQWGAQTSQPKKIPQVIEEVKAVEREMHRQLAIIEGRHISLKSQIAIQDSEAPGDTFLCAGSCETQHIVMGDDAPWNTSHIFLFKSTIVIALETTAPKPTLLERLSVRVKSMPRFVEVKDNRTEDTTPQITVVSGPKTLKKSQMAVKHAFPISACSISTEQRRKAEFVANACKYKVCFSVQLENEDFLQDVNVLTESADVVTSLFQLFNQTVPIRLFQAEPKASEAMAASRRNSASRLSALRSSKPRGRTPKPVEEIPVPEGILGQGTNLDFIVVTHYSSPSDQGASLCADLTTQGFKVSLDCRGDDVVDLSGESATVRRAKALIFFMSPGALLRPWVQADINEARHRKKPIIVIFPRQNGQSTKQFIAQERRLAPRQLHFVFSESGLVPLEIQGVPREAMWEEVLAKLRMARPRPKSGRSVN